MGKTYYAVVDGYIHGAQRARGDAVGPLTERQAKYLLMSGLVSEKPIAVQPLADKRKKGPTPPEPTPTTLDRLTR